MKKQAGTIVYSPSDLIRYAASPYSSWMDRYYLENPDAITPDEQSKDEKLLAQMGDQHERAILTQFKKSAQALVEIAKDDSAAAVESTLKAIKTGVPIIFQAALQNEAFAGFADFLVLDSSQRYETVNVSSPPCPTGALAMGPRPPRALSLSSRTGVGWSSVAVDTSVLTERIGKLSSAKTERVLSGIDVVLGR